MPILIYFIILILLFTLYSTFSSFSSSILISYFYGFFYRNRRGLEHHGRCFLVWCLAPNFSLSRVRQWDEICSYVEKKIHAEFCEKIPGSTHTEMALPSRWKILNKELEKWRDALAKAMDNYRSGENRTNEVSIL